MPEDLIIDCASLRWHHFDDPDDPELSVLAPQYDLHPLALEDCVSPSQRAKLEDYGGYLFFIFNTLQFFEKEEILVIHKLCVFAGSDFVVTVCDGENKSVAAVKAKHAAGQKLDSADKLVHALMDHVCDQFQPLIDAVSEDIGELELKVLERPDPTISMRAFGIKRVLIALRRAAVAHREIVSQLLRREPPFVHPDLRLYFRDIYDHLVLAVEVIEANRDLAIGIIDLNLSSTTHRTNEIVKVLTMYATLLLPLNLTAAFFGMNFDHLPLVHEPFGVPLICLVMLITTILVARYLRRREW